MHVISAEILAVQAEAADTSICCTLQPGFDPAKSLRIDIDRHLQAVIELAEIRVAGNILPVCPWVEPAERQAEAIECDDQQILRQNEQPVGETLSLRSRFRFRRQPRHRQAHLRAFRGDRMAIPFFACGKRDDVRDQGLKGGYVF